MTIEDRQAIAAAYLDRKDRQRANAYKSFARFFAWISFVEFAICVGLLVTGRWQ